MEAKITVNGHTIVAKQGQRLSDVLISNGFSHPRPCGGRGVCGKCKVIVDGKPELACKYVIESDITVEISDEGDMLSESGAVTATHGNGTDLVLDIGTTSLAMALIDRGTKNILKVITSSNPQRRYGADVISRIEYCQRNGVSELTRLIREETRRMISRLCSDRLETLYVAGNTTMLHIFAGVDPTSMGVAPYTPSFLDEKLDDADKFEISGVNNIHLLPSISSFVGADLVAGIHYVGLPDDKYRLLIDLGTNAEIILFSKDKVVATAAAAGPCFEGANISCGMSATSGAIYAYDGKNVKTVENMPARGICGTGLVDVIATLLKRGIIDESGYVEDEEFEVADGITVTQADVRQYQLAKSAIYSAVLTIIKRNGLDFSDIERLYISGGFSSGIDIENAVFTGLIPSELKDVCVSLGNSSLLGTIKSAFNNEQLMYITEKSIYTDLSFDPIFADLFIENMGF